MAAAWSDASIDAVAALLSRNLTETVDNTAALLTVLDTQARLVAQIEGRPHDDVVEEISEQLKQRRRELLRELDAWSDSIELFRRDRPGD